ncbi:MAG: TetR family transcriptional regulator C-terminal domain-containing protein [Gammaproteobacteria bacterium]|nr:TetR family transcriptional regulator C-terminal domain-containing protein [Gammaproteobacteria bacterium]
MELLRTQSVAQLTTRALAQAVGIAQPTLFLHFGSRTQVLLALVDHVQEQLQQGLQSQNLQQLTPLERLRKVIGFHLKFIQRQPGIPRLLFSEELQSGDPALRERMHGLIGFFLDFLRAQIREGQARGELRADLDPQQSACLLVASVQGLAFRWVLSEFRFVLEEQADLMVSTFLDGWQPRHGGD